MRIPSEAYSLCTGCGICAGVCPEGIIEIRRTSGGLYLPTSKHSGCGECGLCKSVCPGKSLNMTDLSSSIFRVDDEGDRLLGHYIECYFGHSTNDVLRRQSSSGGLVSELAIYALEKKLVDGVIVTATNRKEPLEPQVFIARTREEVVLSSGSKYCPVPLGVAIKGILKQNGKFAIVGLPCHIHGVRKAETIVKELRSKIAIHIGLFCSHTINFLGTEYLLRRIGLEKKDVSRLDYRGGEWLSKISIETRNGKATYLPYEDFWQPLFLPCFFTPVRCTMCPDFTNELADISLGDAWLPQLMKNDQGESLVIIRSQQGRQLLQRAVEDGRIWIARVGRRQVMDCCRGNLLFKKKGLAARMNIMRLLGYKVPEIEASLLNPNVVSYILGALLYFSILVSSTNNLQKLLRYVPFPILRLYLLIFRTLKTWGQ